MRASFASISSGSSHVTDNIPSPPALLTAAASSGTAIPPIGAWTIGSGIPTSRQNGVSKIGAMSAS